LLVWPAGRLTGCNAQPLEVSMKSCRLVSSTSLLLALALLAPARSPAQGGDFNAQTRDAFKIFDNLYYVGVDLVSAYVISTSDGLIVIDTLFAASHDKLMNNIRAVGFDPADVEYIFVSHGHGDHAEGAPLLKAATGARVGMAAADWQMTGQAPDMVIADGQSVTLGDTTITFYITPGHTPGVLSMAFDVHDGDQTYDAFMFGGMGLNFSGVDRTLMYLDSVDRVQTMQGIDVNITNHEGAGQIFARADRLAARRPGDPHPFVDPEGFYAWLDTLEENAQAKLVEERAAAAD
jgi:metallo-beta-lactamase class B